MYKKLDHKEIELALLLRMENSAHCDVLALKEQEYVVASPRWGMYFTIRARYISRPCRASFYYACCNGRPFIIDENILKAFQEVQATPNIVMENKDLTTVIAMVSKGLGFYYSTVAYAVDGSIKDL